jgi:hypothetical protein
VDVFSHPDHEAHLKQGFVAFACELRLLSRRARRAGFDIAHGDYSAAPHTAAAKLGAGSLSDGEAADVAAVSSMALAKPKPPPGLAPASTARISDDGGAAAEERKLPAAAVASKPAQAMEPLLLARAAVRVICAKKERSSLSNGAWFVASKSGSRQQPRSKL